MRLHSASVTAVLPEPTGPPTFYPGRIACFMDGERVKRQPARFNGGWIKSDVVGPFKGERGTGHW
jgi:hypothetical protein